MANITDSKESRVAQAFLKKSKDAFAQFTGKNKVVDIDIVNCLADESYTDGVRFNIFGSVETSSPTGKPRVYEYKAVVEVEEKEATFVTLSVFPMEA